MRVVSHIFVDLDGTICEGVIDIEEDAFKDRHSGMQWWAYVKVPENLQSKGAGWELSKYGPYHSVELEKQGYSLVLTSQRLMTLGFPTVRRVAFRKP